ncbi:MAG: hypothetical protein OHK0039_19380 [Bacteroidia bacterium]
MLDRLWDYQRRYGHIRDEDIAACARDLGVSDIEVEGGATFYHFLHRQPAGRHSIYFDTSIVAEHAGAAGVAAAFAQATGAAVGTTNPSGLFGLFPTACIGLSDQAPAALIDFMPFIRLTPAKVSQVVAQLRQGRPVAKLADAVDPQIRYLPPGDRTVFFRDFVPGSALAAAARRGPAGIVSELRSAAFSGRGGAYFPTWIKWKSCQEQPLLPKYVVCNADEGEPGTFKDRVLLQVCPETVVEGMIVAGYAVGAQAGIIYLRGEYAWLQPRLEAVLAAYRAQGLLGRAAGGIAGFDFDI